MGRLDVDAMLAEMPAELLSEWKEYYDIEPWDNTPLLNGFGIVASTFANAHRNSDKTPTPFKSKDFIFDYVEARQKIYSELLEPPERIKSKSGTAAAELRKRLGK